MKDDVIEAQLVTELRTKTAPMELVIQPVTAFQLAALLQLACRHPGVSKDQRGAAERFLAGVRAYFADCPTALDLLRRGDDPNEDRLAQPSCDEASH